jgi:hypothetical protein
LALLLSPSTTPLEITFLAGAHRLPAPVIKEFAGPGR